MIHRPQVPKPRLTRQVTSRLPRVHLRRPSWRTRHSDPGGIQRSFQPASRRAL